jgi:hypothetical protein
VSSISAQASLIVALGDLLAVHAVTGAIRAADLASGDVLTPSGIIEKPGLPPISRPDQFVANAQPAHPSPSRQITYAPPCHAACVPSIHRNPAVKPPAMIPYCDTEPAAPAVTNNPIEAPWKILPWMERAAVRVVFVREIKIASSASDISVRGKMIDVVV